MNKSYICTNNQVIVTDENGLKPAIEFTNNIEEKLISENIIETLNGELVNCNKKYKKNENRILTKKQFVRGIIKWSGITGLMIIICPILMGLLLGNPVSPNTIFGIPMHFSTIMIIGFVPIATLIGIGAAYNIYYDSGVATDQNKALSSERDIIRTLLLNEQEKLQQLNEDKTKNNIEMSNYNQPKNVNDSEKLKEMRNLLVIACNYGCNKEEYQQYFQLGILQEKLRDKYDNNTISIFEQIIEQDLNNIYTNSANIEELKNQTLRKRNNQ